MCRVQMHNCIDFDGLGALFDSAEFVRYGSEARREGEEFAGSVSFGEFCGQNVLGSEVNMNPIWWPECAYDSSAFIFGLVLQARIQRR